MIKLMNFGLVLKLALSLNESTNYGKRNTTFLNQNAAAFLSN